MMSFQCSSPCKLISDQGLGLTTSLPNYFVDIHNLQAASSQLQDGGNATTAQFGIAPRGNILSEPTEHFVSLLPAGVSRATPFTAPEQGEVRTRALRFPSSVLNTPLRRTGLPPRRQLCRGE